MTWADSLAPLRERSFRFYYASRVVVMTGSAMASVALAFAVLAISDSPAALGYVLAAHTVPMVVLLLWGGVIADRFPRTVVLQVSNVASALTQGLIAGLVITGSAEIWMLVVLSALHGTASALGWPAMASMMPSLVPREHLQPANALMSLARSALVIVGPTISALLVVTVGPGWALAVDAATWAVAAVLLGFVTLPPRKAAPAEAPPDTLTELREGWTYVRTTTWLWVVVLGFSAINMIHAGAWFTLGPARAQDTIGEQGWGLVLSAEAVGLLLTTLVLLRVRLQRPLLLGMLGVAVMGAPDRRARRLPPPRPADRPGPARRRRHRGLLDGLEPRDAGARARGDALARLLLRRPRLVRGDADRSDRVRSARGGLRVRRRDDRRRGGVGGAVRAGPGLPRRTTPAARAGRPPVAQHHFPSTVVSTASPRFVATPSPRSTVALVIEARP